MLENDTIEEPTSPTTEAEAPVTQPQRKSRRRKMLDRATAGVAVLVVLGGSGLYYMNWRTAPGVAMLGDAEASAAKLETLLTGGRESLTKLDKSIRETRDLVDRIVVRDDAVLASVKPIDHDPFVFASLEPAEVAAGPQPKNAAADAANAAARELAKNKALAAARLLQLQSIMYGTTRRSCLIDGKLYFEGGTVGDFTVGRIATDAVLVQSGEFKFELRLRK